VRLARRATGSAAARRSPRPSCCRLPSRRPDANRRQDPPAHSQRDLVTGGREAAQHVALVADDGDDVGSFTPFDTASGDGFFTSLQATDGAYNFGAFYYTGKGAEEIVEHRVKGLAQSADQLMVVSQNTTGPLDFAQYWGHGYTAIDYTLELPAGTERSVWSTPSCRWWTERRTPL
jgi:hypothetical protein